MLRAIDCMGFAGGLTYSIVNAGFELVSKHEDPKGFGVPLCDSNRHLLGRDWVIETCEPHKWTTKKVDLVFGNPPCSGFSTLNTSKTRGMDAPINQCMKHFISFAARCAPPMIIMESVQQAFTGGRELMLKLRRLANEVTGYNYTIYHCLHSCAALGGCQIRRRYFLVLSRIPFGVPPVTEVAKIKTAGDVWTELKDKEMSWDGEADGHMTIDTPHAERIHQILADHVWQQGEELGHVMERGLDTDFDFTTYGFNKGTVIRTILTTEMGGHRTVRVRADKAIPVIDGAALVRFVNPWNNRLITHREAVKAMGFPDTWSCKIAKEYRSVGPQWYGKGVTVQCGSWIGKAAFAALAGSPFPSDGFYRIGEDEHLINVSNMFYKGYEDDGERD